MIQLTRLNHKPLIINSDLIQHIETTPDTVLFLTSGQTFMVRETADEVVERTRQYRRGLMEGTLKCPLLERPRADPESQIGNETSKDAR
jgi:flagellar protein FlbD